MWQRTCLWGQKFYGSQLLTQTPPKEHRPWELSAETMEILLSTVWLVNKHVQLYTDFTMDFYLLWCNLQNLTYFKGALTIAKRLDREVRSTDRLTIESSDGTNTARATVKVNITDINDNAPIFTEVFFSFDVPEDTPIGTTVGLVEAVDTDEGPNGEVVYTLLSTWGQSVFHLDPQMGTISLRKSVDFEQVEFVICSVLIQIVCFFIYQKLPCEFDICYM